jgi:hypothetical protein
LGSSSAATANNKNNNKNNSNTNTNSAQSGPILRKGKVKGKEKIPPYPITLPQKAGLLALT